MPRVVPFAKRGPRRERKDRTSPADALTELRGSSARPPRPGALSPGQGLTSPVPPPQAPPPLTSELHPGGRRSQRSPNQAPVRERAGGPRAQQRRTAGPGSAPAKSGTSQPAAVAAGTARSRPAHDPGRQRAGPRRWVPSPKDGRVPGRAALYLGRVGPFFPSSAPGPAGARWPVGN